MFTDPWFKTSWAFYWPYSNFLIRWFIKWILTPNFSEYLLETRFLTSANYSTHPLRIFFLLEIFIKSVKCHWCTYAIARYSYFDYSFKLKIKLCSSIWVICIKTILRNIFWVFFHHYFPSSARGMQLRREIVLFMWSHQSVDGCKQP